MKTKMVLYISLALMLAMIIAGIAFPNSLRQWMHNPGIYKHTLFIHVLTATLFFANVIVGFLWERRSLSAKNNAVVLHTYNTVTWLDAHFSSPMIILSVTAGIMMSFGLGDIWQVGWLSVSFLLFLFSGAVWVISDIPSQYKIKAQMDKLDPSARELPSELNRLLRIRFWISLSGVLPLIIVFALMIYKPNIVAVTDWFK